FEMRRRRIDVDNGELSIVGLSRMTIWCAPPRRTTATAPHGDGAMALPPGIGSRQTSGWRRGPPVKDRPGRGGDQGHPLRVAPPGCRLAGMRKPSQQRTFKPVQVGARFGGEVRRSKTDQAGAAIKATPFI